LLWRDRLAAGSLQVFGVAGPFVDCGTPVDYLRANLAALDAAAGGGPPRAGGGRRGAGNLIDDGAELAPGADVQRSVIGSGSVVRGRIRRCVLWPGATVAEGEQLIDAVRTETGLTVSGAAR
jgi:mannose-1-phosphate guanylyltransferase/MurNAc alpha-1-phosphate uridylyltransferase